LRYIPEINMLTKKTKGFALVDVLIAIALVGLAAVILGSIYPGLRLSRISRSDLVAGGILQSKMVELRGVSFDSLSIGEGVSFDHPELEKLYSGQATYTVEFFDADNDGTPDENIKKITVTVSWYDANSLKSRSLSSLSSNTGMAR
jgi:type II secretory pathway pseudopilin PulG